MNLSKAVSALTAMVAASAPGLASASSRRLNVTSSTNTTQAPPSEGTSTTPIDCTLDPIPTNADDFDEPDWEQILEIAFPTWKAPKDGCPRLDALGGTLMKDYSEFPGAEKDKFNPCYYTKAFAGFDPSKGGYPTPIDTRYLYEFAAPFFKQPGDGSTHHCTLDDPLVDIGSCPKLQNDCGPDCATVTEEHGIGHIPPFVPLAAVKNAYNSCEHDVCKDWFDFDTSGCNIVKSKLDELVIEQFGDGDTVKFQPPILIDGKPSSTYYRLEYAGESPACDDGNCRGPHYCSKEVADEGGIWGDFCPYVHTGENSGKYRHPHLALAALELWIANQCMPEMCATEWLESPNGKDYGLENTMATSITWAEMDDNNDPMAQPVAPYEWPNSGSGVYPGHEMLYGEKERKEDIAPAPYVTEFVDVNPSATSATEALPSNNTTDPSTTDATEAPPSDSTTDPSTTDATEAPPSDNTTDPSTTDATEALPSDNTADPSTADATEAPPSDNTTDPSTTDATEALPSNNTADPSTTDATALPSDSTTDPSTTDATEAPPSDSTTGNPTTPPPFEESSAFVVSNSLAAVLVAVIGIIAM